MSEQVQVQEKRVVEIPDFLTVRQLAELMDVSPIVVIKELMNAGVMANINQQIDYETAAIVAQEMGFEPREETPAIPEEVTEEGPTLLWERLYAGEDPAKLKPRPPVVTVLGHVDHGKTSLLDAIRHTNVVAREAGGITQHIGAYQIKHDGRSITFLDTPGHEAFTAMRARGAHTTDIAVLVVAADDGVMPQTVEAINHARAARVPIIVALNKIDKPTAQPDRVKQQLADIGLTPDDWGGTTLCVPVSAKKKIGLDDLLEAILLVADSTEIKANPDRPAAGTVLEGRLDRTRGATATVLVQNGTLRVGDVVVMGVVHGRVRRMLDGAGHAVQEAPPSTPVMILGLSGVPEAGEMFKVVPDERTARAIVAKRKEELAAKAAVPARAFTLDDFSSRIQAGQVKELNLIIKTDVQGSIEPIVSSLEKLGSEDLKVNIIHAAAGNISESDINLAVASHAIVIGFQVHPDPAARRLAESEGVDIRTYDVIYKLVDEVDKALKGLLEPTYADVVIGEAEVRATFNIPKVGVVAGCYVRQGEARRNARARVFRGEEQLYDGYVASLKRFDKDVREVRTGFECGVGLEDFHDFAVGDVIQFYVKERQEAA
ncbi:MAG TPA: translation initiation factor IF-2 [Thermoflexia bacterium]|nr:MAG: translation initiation factor IF-2 [Chloroflexota bacterium]HEY67295.1 translation initiation factor IF-2 [Thermoflexia bacterium]